MNNQTLEILLKARDEGSAAITASLKKVDAQAAHLSKSFDQTKASAKAFAAASAEVGKIAEGMAGRLGPAGNILAAMGPKGMAAAAGLGAVTAAATALGALGVRAVQQFVDTAGRLSDLALKTQVSTRALQEWNFAGRDVGVTGDQIANAALRASRVIAEGSSATKGAVAALGLSLGSLRSLKPEDQFNTIAAALRGIKDSGEQARIAAAIFGRDLDVLKVIRSDFENARNEAHAFGAVLSDEAIAAGDELGDSLGRLSDAASAMLTQIGATVAQTPGFVDAVGEMASFVGNLARTIAENRDQFTWLFNTMLKAQGIDVEKWAKAAKVLNAAAGGPVTMPASRAPQWGAGVNPPSPDDFLAGSADIAAFIRDTDKLGQETERLIAKQERHAEQIKKTKREWDEAQKAAQKYVESLTAPGGPFASSGSVIAGADSYFGGENDPVKIAEFEKWLAGIREEAAKKAAEGQKKIADATEAAKKKQEEQAEATRRYVEQLGDLRYLVDSITDLFVTMGGNIDSTFGKLLRGASLGLGAMEALAKATSKTQKAAILAQTAAGAYEGGSAMGGALSGAMAGSMFGPWGAAIGGVAGGILGLFGGKSKVKQQLAEMRAQLLEQFGGSMDALRKKAASLGIDISKAFTTKSPKELQATIDKLNKAMEEQKKKLEALSIAAQGFVGLAQEWGKQIAESGATEEMQAQFDRLGLYATAIFAGIVRETGDVIGAFKQIGEGLSEMRKRQEEFGLSASETTQKLLDLYGIVENNEGAANALSFLNQMMTGLVDAGMKSQQLFSAFGADAVKIFNDLVAGGATSNQALALMQPTLQRLWEMHHDLGYELDENTKKLLDQAEEQGLVGENMRSVNDKILQVLLAIGEALGATIPDGLRRTGDAAEQHFGRFRNAAESAGDALPGGGRPGGFNQDWPDADHYGLPGYATGGRVNYTPGGKAVRVAEEQTENILTDAQLAGIMKRAGVAGGGGMPSSLSINLNVDGVQLGTYVVKLTNEGLADGRVRVPSRAIAERNG